MNLRDDKLLALMLHLWGENNKLLAENKRLKMLAYYEDSVGRGYGYKDMCNQLETQLQDANRKLAAMGGITTSELVEVWARRANPPDAKTLERSIGQLDWALLEDHEARIYEDWKETRNDAQDIGVQ